MKAQTSTTNPIDVAWAPAPAPVERLGMTFAPGKKQASSSSGPWDRDLAQDLRRLRHVYHADTLVSLLEDRELEALGIADLVAAARVAGIALIRFPIPDGSVPVSLPDARALIRDLVRELQDARTVVVHCIGGHLGRAGLVVACMLAALGASTEDALAGIVAARPGTVENPAQEDFVRRFGTD